MAKVTKKDLNERLSASDYAYVPDPKKPSTWKLRIDDAHHVEGAIAALGKGYRGEKVVIPQRDLPAVKRKVLAAWRKFHGKDEKPPSILTNGLGDSMYTRNCATTTLNAEQLEHHKRHAHKRLREADVHPKDKKKIHDKIEDAEDKDDIDDIHDHIDDAEEHHKKHGKPLPDDETPNNPNTTENRQTMVTNAKHPRHMSDDELHASHKLHLAELNKRAIDRGMGLGGGTAANPGNMHSFDESFTSEDPLESMQPSDLEDIDWDDEFLGEGGPRVPADGLGGVARTQVDETHGAAGLFGPAVPSHNNLTGNAAVDERNWFAAIPPRYQEVIRNAAEIENRERGVLLQRLTANMSEENRYKAIKRYGNMPLNELRDMINMFAANAQSVNTQPPDLTPIFLGGSGGAFQAPTTNEQLGSDAILPLPVMNLKEE